MNPSDAAVPKNLRRKVSAGLISGQMIDGNGAGVQGYVQVVDSGGQFVSNASPDGNGNWTTSTGLLTGTYYALASASLSGYSPHQLLYNGIDCSAGCDVTTGAPIAVTEGSTTPGINFVFTAPGAISGNVIDATTGLPVGGVEVYLYTASGAFAAYGYTSPDGSYTTSPNAPVPTGTYFARTNNFSGYVNQVYDNIACQNCDPTTGTPIPVVGEAVTPGINFALHTAGLISGQMIDGNGAGVQGYVQVVDSGGQFVSNASPDGNGNWTTSTGLLTGTYYALASASLSGYSPHQLLYNGIDCSAGCDVTTGAPIAVTEGSTTPGINFVFTAPGVISGNVIDATTGLPVGGVEVYLYTASGAFAAYGYTSPDGSYTTSPNAPVPTGTYFARTNNFSGYVNQVYDNIACQNCDPTTGTPIPVVGGAVTPGINFALHTAGLISGQMIDGNGAGVQGYVQVVDSGLASLFNASPDGNGNWTTSTGLLTGTYYALASASLSGYSPHQLLYNGIDCSAGCDVTTGAPIAVTEGSTTPGINFVFTAPGAISGNVIDATTGLPVGGVEVYLYTASGAFAAYGYTSPDGSYTTSPNAPVPTGTYFARTNNFSGYVNQVYDNIACQNCDPTTGTPIPVVGEAVTPGINFAMGSGSCLPITILPPSLGSLAVGGFYSLVLYADGGARRYTISRVSGALPDGLSLNPSSGVLSGMATTPGTFTFTVTATDQNGCVGRRTYTVTVSACPAATVMPSGGTVFCVGGSVTLTANAGCRPPVVERRHNAIHFRHDFR